MDVWDYITDGIPSSMDEYAVPMLVTGSIGVALWAAFHYLIAKCKRFEHNSTIQNVDEGFGCLAMLLGLGAGLGLLSIVFYFLSPIAIPLTNIAEFLWMGIFAFAIVGGLIVLAVEKIKERFIERDRRKQKDDIETNKGGTD